MVDTLKKVRTGDALRIPARTYNAFIDAAHDHQRRSTQIEGSSKPTLRQADIVLVRNDSGSDQPRLSVLGIDGPVIPPDANLGEFQNRVALSCITPAAGVHEGKFVVLIDPIAAGKMGRAYAAGVCPVRIDVPDENRDYRFADVGGVTGSLTTSPDGSATILWREGGTGVQWAVVRLGRPGPDAAKFDRGTITDNSAAPDHTVNMIDNGSVTATEINGWTLLEGTDVFVWEQDGTWYFDGAYSAHATDAQYDIDETAADSWDVEDQSSNEIGVKWSCLVPYQGDLLNTARLWLNEIEVFTDGRGNVIHVASAVDSGHIDFTHHIEDADWHNVQGGNPAEGTLLRYDDSASRWMYLEPPADARWLSWNQGAWVFGYPDHEFFKSVPDPRDGDSADPFHRNVDDSNVDTSASGIIVLRPDGQASRTWEFLSTSGVDEGCVLTVQADGSLDWQEASGGGFSKLVKVNQAGTTPDVQECDESGATAGGDTYDNVGVIHGMHCPGNTMGLLIKDKDGNNVFLPHDFV